MLFYRIFIWLYPKGVWLASFFNSKAKMWLQGRDKVFDQLADVFRNNTRPVLWMHCSSLGEFEQGLPLLEICRKQYPSHLVLLSFFSPSGYEIRKNHPVADHVCYLPMDSASNARHFLRIVQPALVVFVKYEYWYFFLREIYRAQIPLLLVSGIFRKNQPFFKWYGDMHKKMLSFFSCLLVQNEPSALLLRNIGFADRTLVTGDTRFDRVLEIAANSRSVPDLEAFCGSYNVIIAGSTWTDDDEELDHFANTRTGTRFIIAPHDIDTDRLKECLSLYKHAILYSDYRKRFETDGRVPEDINVLIIDNMGMLSSIYRYATVCYVGGGFSDDGIHNILEAAVYGKPVIFGPVYDKYAEAEELLDSGGAFTIDDALELESVLTQLLENREQLQTASEAAGRYVQENSGATARIMQYIQVNRLLIN
jgi:3-deoxy-D-manno-octulosonic-acid transferase